MPFQIPAALTFAECKLLDEKSDLDLLQSHNAALEQLRLLTRAFGDEILADDYLTESLASLGIVRTKLTKTHYSIGFLGTTQNGKSTACNYVLDVTNPDEQPCKEGAGMNTTSTVTRLRKGSRELRLCYMTRDEFREKRELLCLATGIAPEANNSEILNSLPQRVQEFLSGKRTKNDTGKQILEKDFELLTDLLQTERQHGVRLQDPAPEVPAKFEQRERYANYGPDADGANALLREARIVFDSKYLPDNLEMFDLPGPGAANSVDQWTTRQFLPQMDGAMLFLSAARLGDEAIETLVSDLRWYFKERMSFRVWVVFTRWDSPARAALLGRGEQSIFTEIDAFLKAKAIEYQQACFVCGPWYLSNRAHVEEHFRTRMSTPGSAIPEALKSHPELAGAFEALFDGGGIIRLRNLILDDLPIKVRDELRRECKVRLADIRKQLAHKFDLEKRRRSATSADRQAALKGNTMATEVLVAIRRDPDKAFEKQAVRLRDELQKHFSVVCPRADVLQETGDVPERFPLHVRELESKLRDMVVADILPALYRHWQIEFGKLPSVQVFEADSDPAAAWKRMGMDDSAMANWTGAQFPTFVDRLLFGVNDPDARHDLNSGTAYWSMMREKIGLVAQQAVHSLRVRLLTRARSIQSELSQLAHRNGEVESEHGQGSRAGIDEDLARIKELAQ